MAKNDSNFMQVLRSIIGDRVIPEAQMAAIRKQWDANPNALIAQANAAKQKTNNRIISQRLRETPVMTVSRPSLVRSTEMPSKIDYKGPSQRDIIEQRLNSGDMSMFSNFGRAFNEARNRGQSEFTWRETGANPSGRFNTQLRPKLPVDNFDDSDYFLENAPISKVEMNPPYVNTPSWEQELFDPVPYPWADQVREQQRPKINMPEMKQEDPFVKSEKARTQDRMDRVKKTEEEDVKNRQKERQARGNFERAHGFSPRWGEEDHSYNRNLGSFERAHGFDPSKRRRAIIHQQGGAIGANDQELQKAFMAFLIEDAAAQGMQIQSEQDLQAYAQQLGEEGLKAKYQEFMQKMQGGVKAALGAKLNYIHKLKGNCPDGYEMIYMKQGGRVCPVCQKKAEKAKEGKKLPKKNAVADFKEKRKHINSNDTVNTKFGPRDLNGNTKYKKYDANKENYDFETRKRVQEKDEKSGKKVFGSACGSKLKKK